MESTEHLSHAHNGWLDKLAIGMAAVCAVHCLLMPVLIVALPIIATSFFVHKDFHLWMLFLVIPTTTFSIFMGCRQHKDRRVMTFCAIGLALLVSALCYERLTASEAALASDVCLSCAGCADDAKAADADAPLNASIWINTLGGAFLAVGHFRNFRLCRKSACSHEH